jgi:hypothetical protein
MSRVQALSWPRTGLRRKDIHLDSKTFSYSLPVLHRALTGSPPRKQIWSLGISPLTNNAATSAESGLDQKSTFRNVRFWRKADIFTDTDLTKPNGRHRILRNCLGTAKKASREYRLER